MDRPQPKELVVRRWVNAAPFLFLTPSSEDARRWIEQEAPRYGQLFPPIEGRSHFILDITDTYDVDEVLAYLQSYNESAAE